MTVSLNEHCELKMKGKNKKCKKRYVQGNDKKSENDTLIEVIHVLSNNKKSHATDEITVFTKQTHQFKNVYNMQNYI